MMTKLNSPKKDNNNNLESSKDIKSIKEINADINNFDIINRPSISDVRKIDPKFNNNNNSENMENKPINKVVTFGNNKNSLASNYSNNIKDIRDPTIDEMNYFFKVNENNINDKGIKKKKNLGNKKNVKKNTIKKEVYKEKAMKINVKKFDGVQDDV